MKKIFIMVVAATLILNGCKKQQENIPGPSVKTIEVKGVTSYTAFVSGEVSDESGEIAEKGFCWSKTPNPSVSDSKKKILSDGSSFYGTIQGLTENTEYYVSAYATNSGGTSYGQAITLKTQPIISDASGNVYSTVKIGNQTWMAESLKTTKFSNGDPIPEVTSQWGALTTPACCSYENDLNISQVYGKFYNWYTASDTRNVCPIGWHVPGAEEWNTMVTSLGGTDLALPKLKETGPMHWIEEIEGTDNSSGFTVLGSGKREGDLSHDIKWWAFFWTSSPSESNESYGVAYIVDVSVGVIVGNENKSNGYTIRCIKD